MYLLYLDESGNENDPADRYFVLAGLALFERQTYFLANALDEIQRRHFPNSPPVPFHTYKIANGKGFWRKVPADTRSAVLREIGGEILRSPDRGRALFAVAIEKTDKLWGEDAVERATEEICKKFDTRLQREYQQFDNPQRGLIVFSEGRFDARAKIWVRGFQQRGTKWGAITNLADIPYFASMKESRLLQAADFVSHGVWRLYEKRDSSLIGALIPCFDNQGGILHGLAHVRADPAKPCDCPACVSRHSPGDFGTWI